MYLWLIRTRHCPPFGLCWVRIPTSAFLLRLCPMEQRMLLTGLKIITGLVGGSEVRISTWSCFDFKSLMPDRWLTYMNSPVNEDTKSYIVTKKAQIQNENKEREWQIQIIWWLRKVMMMKNVEHLSDVMCTKLKFWCQKAGGLFHFLCYSGSHLYSYVISLCTCICVIEQNLMV